jgi:hypothetical protein
MIPAGDSVSAKACAVRDPTPTGRKGFISRLPAGVGTFVRHGGPVSVPHPVTPALLDPFANNLRSQSSLAMESHGLHSKTSSRASSVTRDLPGREVMPPRPHSFVGIRPGGATPTARADPAGLHAHRLRAGSAVTSHPAHRESVSLLGGFDVARDISDREKVQIFASVTLPSVFNT